jgi:hypothetical protein
MTKLPPKLPKILPIPFSPFEKETEKATVGWSSFGHSNWFEKLNFYETETWKS